MPLYPTPTYIWPDTDRNITWLPLDNPLCANDTCLAYVEAHDASQAQISWGSQFLYGHYVLMIWGCVLGLAMVFGSARRTEHFYGSRSSVYLVEDSPTTGQKAIAAFRSIAYRRASGRVANMKSLPNLGTGVLALAAWLAAVLLMFVQHPYYRESRGYGSPPLGVRAGLAGTAMTPIVFALSGKYNLCGLIYLFFALVHTIPFLINDYGSGGPRRLWYQSYNAGLYEYTGIAPLAVLVFLAAFYNPWFRSLGYEIFAHTHVLAAVAYLGTMLWHGAQQKDTRHYLWASMAIWVIQLAAGAWDKTAMFETRRKYRTGTAHVSVLDDSSSHSRMMRIAIKLPLRWSPGQHAFLRFPRLGILDNHPFTIASVPHASDGTDDQLGQESELVFLVRPYHGLTRRLFRRALDARQNDGEAFDQLGHSNDSSYRLHTVATLGCNVRIDDPYGVLSQHPGMHKLYGHVILVAGGGGGISAMLPWLIELSSRVAEVGCARRVQRVNLIWCIRHASAKDWVEQELDTCRMEAGKVVQIDIYTTGDVTTASVPHRSAAQVAEVEEKPGEETPPSSCGAGSSDEMRHGRPYLPKVLEELVTLRKTLIMGCGPESLKIDLSNAAARLQRLVLDNRVEEGALHTETFGW